MSERSQPAHTRRVELHAVAAAVAFLTRVPVGRSLMLTGDDVARAALAFPLVGAAIGAAVGAIADALRGPLTPLLAAALALAAGTALTGALHLDGLADAADALGADSRERSLAIMRDHSVGAYGAAAVVLDLLVKVAALATLARAGRALEFALAAGAISRWAPVALASALPYARAHEGTAASFTRRQRWRAAGASAIALACVLAAAGWDGLIGVGIGVALVLALGFACRRWLRGVTGDILGAAVELVEAAVLVAAVAIVHA